MTPHIVQALLSSLCRSVSSLCTATGDPHNKLSGKQVRMLAIAGTISLQSAMRLQTRQREL